LSERNYKRPFAADIAVESIQKAFVNATDLGLKVSVCPLPHPGFEELKSWFSMPLRRNFYSGCTNIYNNLRIDPAGNLIPCLEYRLGNILEEDLIDILNGISYKAFREHLEVKGPFEGCLRCCNMEVNKLGC